MHICLFVVNVKQVLRYVTSTTLNTENHIVNNLAQKHHPMEVSLDWVSQIDQRRKYEETCQLALDGSQVNVVQTLYLMPKVTRLL